MLTTAIGIVQGINIRRQADTATDDSMSDADATNDTAKRPNLPQPSLAAKTRPAAAKPARMLEIQEARELFRQLRQSAR